MNISPLSSVSPKALIGEGVIIDPFAVIENDVVIGDRTHIMAHAVIMDGARIGKDCKIFPGAVIAGIPQDLKFKGEKTTAEIGDRTTIRECSTVNRGTASKGRTIIGDDCLIMAYSHIAHDCLLRNHVIISNASQIAGEVEIDDYAIISGGVLVHQFTRISKHVMIQGGSRVGKDIPPYILVGRDPIVYCGINIVGLRRRNFTSEQITEIQDIYRTLYTRGLNTGDALKTVVADYDANQERDLILSFIKESKRGIVRGPIV